MKMHGFSLIELMVVITIIGLIAVMVRINTSFFTARIVRAQLELLASVCQYARQSALATNTTEIIMFDTQTHSYRWRDRVEKLPLGLRFGVIPGVKGPPSNPTTTLSNPITFSGSRITFYPDGIIQSGTVYMVDAHNSIMYALSNAVAQISYLRMYRYDGAWKLL